ncbi:MATE family efflux transporter [Pseudoflavonifractor sp. 524-17]|uniref:MATE family efflux transporter n=1 Tax=Pseudoflavonifractor sp. 524-17 TaxID=2304577 RepID=UPI0013799D0D|nr:MATE family efflux transporter [Pseudoflavonifractor sp. 524-17]NCE64832.1 MATE family efflux transporter [Pseudoflavonifractor sp. 524-17]
MEQQLAQEFRFPELLRFALPSIIMMMFTSLYTVVDGYFVSNYVGAEAMAALNLIYPVQSTAMGLSFMFSTGGGAIVAIRMGQGRMEEANRAFTLVMLAAAVVAGTVTALTLWQLEPLCRWLGAEGATLQPSRVYLGTLICFNAAAALQYQFQSFLITAGRPKLGLGMSMAAGGFNMVFDYLLIVPGKLGVAGAALATGGGYCIAAAGGLIFFFWNRKGLHFVRPRWEGRMLLRTCANGSSEMVTNLSAAVTTLLFNFYTLRFAGTDGVAAITAMFYCQFLMTSLFFGFTMGAGPVISYHFGAEHRDYLRRVLRQCLWFVLGASVLIFGVSILGAEQIVGAFFQPGSSVYAMAVEGFRLFALSFLFSGLNISASALFTALGDGTTSAQISFARTLVLEIAAVAAMAYFWQLTGVWLAIPVSELLTVALVLPLLRRLHTRFHIF